MSSPIVVDVFGRTDVGRTREHNEDAFVVADLTRANATLQPEVRQHIVGDRGTLFMVADGMGGAAAGEIASAMAIDSVLHDLSEAIRGEQAPDDEQYATAIKRATAAANARIHAFALDHPEYRGMGTTATVAGLLGDTLYVAQVGDSRAYLIRDGKARQITKDQSLMQKLIEAGEITEQEAELSERRNIILQALGPEANIKVDLTHQRVRRGDVLVLCSDGLSGLVKADEIAQIVSEELDPGTACKRMIDLANENGGPDNITVITARFDGEGLAQPSGEDPVGHSIYLLASDIVTADSARRMSGPGIRTTGPTTAPRRTTAKLSREASASNAAPPPETNAQRRRRGSLIALIFLVLLLASATWWGYRALQDAIVPRQHTTESPKPGT